MTKGEAITALYAVFNAPHNADINIAYLNKILDDLVAKEREACARACENLSIDRGTFHPDDQQFKEGVLATARMCSLIIRSRT